MLTRSLLVLALASALSLLWGGASAPHLASLWAEAGCTLDPSGCAASHGDNGCTADPDGCTRATTHVDAGCTADPDGCTSASYGDNGCSADPSGALCADRR